MTEPVSTFQKLSSLRGSSASKETDVAEVASPGASLRPAVPPVVPDKAPVENFYDYEQCTVVAILQFRPSPGPGLPRPILVSVQNGATNKEELPILRLYPDGDLGGPLPPALLQQLTALEVQLPERKARHDQRVAQKKTGGIVPGRNQAVGGQSHVPASKRLGSSPAKSAPPVPAKTPPMPSTSNLELGDIFDFS